MKMERLIYPMVKELTLKEKKELRDYLAKLIQEDSKNEKKNKDRRAICDECDGFDILTEVKYSSGSKEKLCSECYRKRVYYDYNGK